MKKSLLALTLVGTLLTACGEQQAAQSTASSAPAANTAPVGGKGTISEDRSAAFKSFMPTFSQMRKMANGDLAFEPEAFKTAAAQFTKEARVPFEHFQSDPNGNGDALPNIWAKPDEFKAEQEKFFAAVDKLNTVAQTGKLDDIKVAFGDVVNSCQSCHDTYRRPK